MREEDSIRLAKDFKEKTDLTLKMLLRDGRNFVLLWTACVFKKWVLYVVPFLSALVCFEAPLSFWLCHLSFTFDSTSFSI